ncbi:MAG: hypothetical protein P8100_06680 [bacterium]|jgi:hypothetical protein
MSQHDEMNTDRIDMVRTQLKKKTIVWASFLLFGWSYGSLGNLTLQLLWYVIPLVSGIGIYHKLVLHEFTLYTAFALIGVPGWILWNLVRMITLNKEIDRYNRKLADIFGLSREERYSLDID